MVKNIIYIAVFVVAASFIAGCSKVSPTGLLIAASNVDDRYDQAQYWFNRDDRERSEGLKYLMNDDNGGEYSFLLGADPHIVDSLTRIREFFDESVLPSEKDASKPKYKFCAILGDLVDTKAEFYSNVNSLYKEYKDKYKERYVKSGDENSIDMYRMFAVVGNHDITHNGWAMFYDIFGISSYAVLVVFQNPNDSTQAFCDVHLFLDSANGTMGQNQYDKFIVPILEMAENDKMMDYALGYLFNQLLQGTRTTVSDNDDDIDFDNMKLITRHKFIYTHNPFFRSRLDGFSSNYPREEYYRLLDTFANKHVDYVFAGHLHDPGYAEWRGVKYVLLDAFGERNRPAYGEVCNVTCKKDGTIKLDYIHLK